MSLQYKSCQIGCCGFAESMPLYFKEFSVVEVQQTFYQPPKLATVKKWRQQAPHDFEFTLKAWQLITHEPSSPTYRRLREKLPEHSRGNYGSFKPTKEVHDAWLRTREVADALHARVIVFQCPASFCDSEIHRQNLRDFFTSIDREECVFCWEPRGDWPDDAVRELCSSLNLVHCVDRFVRKSLHGRISYFRLHGIKGYRYAYSSMDLRLLYDWCPKDRPGYVLFNNLNMLSDARKFKAMLRQ